jgi:YggT family protein
MISMYLSIAVRGVVFLLFLLAAIIAGTHWAVRNKHLQPFGPLPRGVRRLGDPLIKPLERRILQRGGNPVNAPYYFFWLTLLGGLAVIGLTEWLVGLVYSLTASASAGPRGLLLFAVNSIFSILILALFVRIIASWIGLNPYSKLMRVVHALTDWLLDPLRRVLPPLGPFDLSPLVAYLMLSLARWFVLGLL